jgi:hypothetical protein
VEKAAPNRVRRRQEEEVETKADKEDCSVRVVDALKEPLSKCFQQVTNVMYLFQ